MAVPANHEYPTVTGTVVVLCGKCVCSCVLLCVRCWLYIVAVPANHEYPTVAGTVVYTAWLVYVLLSIGIAWKARLVGQKVGWRCLPLMPLQCQVAIA